MDERQAEGLSKRLTRRRMLQVAGGAGLAAVGLGACTSTPPAGDATRAPATTSPEPTTPAGAPPPPPEQPAAPVKTAQLLCRNAWGAQPPRGPGKPNVPRRLTLHHTAAYLGDNSLAPSRLRQHQRYHQDTQGWIDIAYHISVDRNGNLYQLRDYNIVGDTATNYDPTNHFLVVCEGNFEEEPLSEAQIDGVVTVFAWAVQKFGINPATLQGHRDASHDTACPGTNLYALITSGELERRIAELADAGPVELQEVCGAEAQAIVADIEAGRR